MRRNITDKRTIFTYRYRSIPCLPPHQTNHSNLNFIFIVYSNKSQSTTHHNNITLVWSVPIISIHKDKGGVSPEAKILYRLTYLVNRAPYKMTFLISQAYKRSRHTMPSPRISCAINVTASVLGCLINSLST